MENYNPSGFGKHTVKLKFLYENAKAEVIAEMGGNVCGGSILNGFTDLDCGITARSKESVNRKHCRFFLDDLQENRKFAEVEGIYFFYPNSDSLEMDIEDATDYLISVEIIYYENEE
ncbi:hypothetical protein EV207_101133 [Scopulibacillus darangshiensis]|uniref:Uncharacterized protein n=1 Tax=Scopulibacillus darangshiensis TaxID=442528 RepID=A0A4R2PE08_9BACL|nr:hypothetical protein [Scopulibacillus darangshiensis]TCP32155.1 hypothetical protein EV207_101133 [Scopulibacillus darangshiensis]